MQKGLDGVAVGDEVVVTDVNRKEPQRAAVTNVGRVYVSTKLGSFHIGDGYWQNKDYRSHRHAYTLAQWARREAEAALREQIRQISDARSFDHLSDDDVALLTAALRDANQRLGAQ